MLTRIFKLKQKSDRYGEGLAFDIATHRMIKKSQERTNNIIREKIIKRGYIEKARIANVSTIIIESDVIYRAVVRADGMLIELNLNKEEYERLQQNVAQYVYKYI